MSKGTKNRDPILTATETPFIGAIMVKLLPKY